MCSYQSFRPARRVEKMQGTLMKLVGQLEQCKNLLHDIEKEKK